MSYKTIPSSPINDGADEWLPDNFSFSRITSGDGLSGSANGSMLADQYTSRLAVVYVAVVVMVFLVVTGALGNVLVILAVLRTPKLRTVTNVFIINLSVCDLLLLTSILPFNIYTYIYHERGIDDQLCKAIGFLGYSFAGTTLINICLIAWNRYKLISDRNAFLKIFQPGPVTSMVLFSWLIPPLCLLPSLLEIWGRFGYVAVLVTCNLYVNHHTQSFKLMLLFARALLPSIIIAYCYIFIHRLSRVSRRRLQAKVTNAMSFERRSGRHDLRLTRTMCIICLLFLLSYLPCLITGIIDWYYLLSRDYHMYCEITVYIGSAFNPVIYGVMNSQFREAFYSLVCCKRSNGKHRAGVNYGKIAALTSCNTITSLVNFANRNDSRVSLGAPFTGTRSGIVLTVSKAYDAQDMENISEAEDETSESEGCGLIMSSSGLTEPLDSSSSVSFTLKEELP